MPGKRRAHAPLLITAAETRSGYDARRIAAVNARKVFYDIDTAGGQSGSAVYRVINGARYAFAIHAYGGASTNSGTRIITPVYNNLVPWKA